ncbi:cytochrome c [Roseibacterium sp. SDUM158016]|uniref:c-type cytochrome n=1 Tax=Roseicyclus sediminis TaxID=2980997 RepID=UPI0021CF2411|nr:cytochrome c [Roseibacterium sp. SDUM158016]MCU4653564.1 cytochrome c [Roseibacterium sp. SDUM158016]
MRVQTLCFCLSTALAALPVQAQDAEEGRALYTDFCAVCHGESLQGDGPMAELLRVEPADLTQLMKEGGFPVLDVAQRIDGRMQLRAHGGEMPLFGSFFEGQGRDVAMVGQGGQPVMVSRPIADLIAYLMEVQS